ncbi:hypothetical protein [Subtercola sp. YIM 133946]|uniref:hypothetical protein n=1 Tax=Subtercola sp. YIM 133946 TaxID=3118909 RepID=UPI002F9209D2
MLFVLGQALSSGRDDLLRETASVLGYSRLTEASRRTLDGVLAAAVAAGRITDDDGRLRAAL